MTRDAKTKTGVSFCLLATLLTGCAGFSAITSIITTAIGGTFLVRSQTVERTFVAPAPEVKEASRRALEEMAFTIKHEGARKDEYYILATGSDDYEVEVTVTPVTSKATKVSVKADSLPERDKATGLEIINQMAAILSPSPPPQIFASANSEIDREVLALQRIHASPLQHPPVLTAENQPATGEDPPPIPEDHATRNSPMREQHRTSAIDAELERASPQTVGSEVAEGEETLTAQQIYEGAIREYVQGDFPAAVEHFRTYLAAQPDRAQKPRALYWLGESLYSQREYADALLQFETILRDYPQSPAIPGALLKGAHAYRQYGETRRAVILLQTLIKEHSTSREAQIARDLVAAW